MLFLKNNDYEKGQRRNSKKANFMGILCKKNGKLKHRIIANLSKWPPELIEGLRKLLKDNQITAIEEWELTQGKGIGGIFVINGIANRLGIRHALESSKRTFVHGANSRENSYAGLQTLLNQVNGGLCKLLTPFLN